MAARWIETVTGSLDDKKRYRQYRKRLAALPPAYRDTLAALTRYLTYFGAISNGTVAMSMLDDLGDLIEQSAADGTPVRDIVGDDPVAFAEDFVRNYADGQWIKKERERLTSAIDRAAGDQA